MERYEFSYDRRGFPRILSGYPVDIEIENPPAGIPPSISGEIGNLGSEGASLILNSSLPVSAIVTLRLDLSPHYSLIETKAQVMWSYFLARNKKFNCGVRFLDLEEKHREVLNKLMEQGIENNKSVPERRRSDRRTKTKELKERLWKAEMVLKKVKKTMDRRVVITGLGVITPNGIGKEAFWKAIKSGKSGIKLITKFDVSKLSSKVAGEVSGFNPLNYMSEKEVGLTDRSTRFGLACTKMAIEDSNLRPEDRNPEKTGVAIGTALGGIGFSHEQHVIYLQEGLMAINPYTASIVAPNSCTNYISIMLNAKGPSQTFSSSCTAGADAIGYGYNAIRRGEADIMCVGGTDAPLFPGIFGAFCRLRILVTTTKEDTKVPRPFDLNRDGTVISEGAAILVLEELEHALQRGAHIYAEIVGYGSTCDAYHIVKPLPGGEQAARAIRIALEDANLRAEEVDYINAHGTATPKNDKVETKVIKDVFKQHAYRLAVSATKSMVGHTQGACGAIEAICCALAVKHDILPPTINYETPDPECDLDYVPNKARKVRVNIALSNSFGFGGKNSVLVIKKYETK